MADKAGKNGGSITIPESDAGFIIDCLQNTVAGSIQVRAIISYPNTRLWIIYRTEFCATSPFSSLRAVHSCLFHVIYH